MKNIGELLKNIMEERNLTVEDLCVLLDLYENEVKEVLIGRRKLKDRTLRKISLIFKKCAYRYSISLETSLLISLSNICITLTPCVIL